jgi:HSP20 family protein
MAKAAVMQKEPKRDDRLELFDWLDRRFDDWAQWFPLRPSNFGQGWTKGDMIRVDEFRDNGTLVVRAEMPGVDPDKDVHVTVTDGMLHITAERREEQKSETKTYVRNELRYGSFARVLPLPAGVTDADVTATYRDGMLEIRVPMPEKASATKIPISKR